ncbi:hypothetical protein [Niallia sp. FSL K6-0077]|uniref:hypothetical protein n=1 Tax=Niallia sp. FSL K6-0077 TaxID=2954743 RepID=UPI0030F79789
MKIKYQLAIIFFILIISLLGIGGFSNMSLQSLIANSKELTEAKEIQRLVTHLQYRIAGISNDERAFLLEIKNIVTESMRKNQTFMIL